MFGFTVVSVLASSAVCRGLEPRSGQTKDYEIGMCCFSAKQKRTKTGWFGIGIICTSGATCLPVKCCFSQLAL